MDLPNTFSKAFCRAELPELAISISSLAQTVCLPLRYILLQQPTRCLITLRGASRFTYSDALLLRGGIKPHLGLLNPLGSGILSKFLQKIFQFRTFRKCFRSRTCSHVFGTFWTRSRRSAARHAVIGCLGKLGPRPDGLLNPGQEGFSNSRWRLFANKFRTA